MKQWYSAVLKPRSGMSAANTFALTVCTSLCSSHVTRLQCCSAWPGLADDESLDVSRDSTVCMGLQELGLDSEHRTSANPKRRNSQVELRNSQGDSPAPAMRGLTN